MVWLHVAAMPFPTRQGTQNVVREICAASAGAGRETHLFAYAGGVAWDDEPAFAVHRVGDFPRVRSLRSGPSVGKALLDARMTAELGRLVRRLRPRVIVAHHVEAAAMATLVARRFVFFAHTDLGAELPTYAPGLRGIGLGLAGAEIDRALARRAAGVATISPALAEHLRALTHDRARVRYVPAPWPVPAPMDDDERRTARRALGLAADACVALYAGNLDAYQGWERVVEALGLVARRVPAAQLVVGTASDRAPLELAAKRLGLGGRLSVHGLANEAARRTLHAAADVAVVPRRTPGGLPVKLLDALARGVPCVVTPTATAGLALGEVAHVTVADDAHAIAGGIETLWQDHALCARLAAAGRAFITRHHSRAQFLTAIDEIAAIA